MELVIANADITQVALDILVMKHAEGFRGADEAVARAVGFTSHVRLGDFTFQSGYGTAAHEVLFIGVGPLHSFRYEQIEAFGRRAISLTHQHRNSAKHVGFTIHGPGYGLDLEEAFLSLIAGMIAEVKQTKNKLKRITIVERSPKRCDELFAMLHTRSQEFGLVKGTHRSMKLLEDSVQAAEAQRSNVLHYGSRAETRPRLFVAMPFADEFIDEFEIGFREAAKESDFICERLDVEHFTGDIMAEIKKRIIESHGVLALLNGHNPNVFLEIGFSFAHNKPTILVTKQGDELPFDVSGHRCIRYKSITQLRDTLTKEIAALKSAGVLAKGA